MDVISGLFALLLAAGISPAPDKKTGSNLSSHAQATCLQSSEPLAQLDPSIVLANSGHDFISANEAREIATILAKRESSPVFQPNSDVHVESVGLCWEVTFKNVLQPDARRGISDRWTIILRKANGEIVEVG